MKKNKVYNKTDDNDKVSFTNHSVVGRDRKKSDTIIMNSSESLFYIDKHAVGKSFDDFYFVSGDRKSGIMLKIEHKTFEVNCFQLFCPQNDKDSLIKLHEKQIITTLVTQLIKEQIK